MSPAARPRTRKPPDPDPEAPRAARQEPEGRTHAERSSWGRSIRDGVSRKTWSDWTAAADRPDPVGLLLSQSAVRVPDLVPIRHGRMLEVSTLTVTSMFHAVHGESAG